MQISPAKMPIPEAEKILGRIQKRNRPSPGKLKGDKVTIVPLPGNLFRIDGRRCIDPDKTLSYQYLKCIGAAIEVIHDDQSLPYYSALATWDSALHYLARTSELTERKISKKENKNEIH